MSKSSKSTFKYEGLVLYVLVFTYLVHFYDLFLFSFGVVYYNSGFIKLLIEIYYEMCPYEKAVMNFVSQIAYVACIVRVISLLFYMMHGSKWVS